MCRVVAFVAHRPSNVFFIEDRNNLGSPIPAAKGISIATLSIPILGDNGIVGSGKLFLIQKEHLLERSALSNVLTCELLITLGLSRYMINVCPNSFIH